MRIDPKTYTFDVLERAAIATALRFEVSRLHRIALRKREFLKRPVMIEHTRQRVRRELETVEMDHARAVDLLATIEDIP